SKEGQTFKLGPGGAQICQNGKCHSAAGQTIDNLTASNYGPISQSKVAAVAALKHVKTAAGGLALTDTGVKIPKNFGGPSSQPPTPNSFNVNGVDTSHLSLGPLSAGTVTSGRSLTGADAHSNVAVVDSGYAKTHKLKVGSKVSIAKHSFTVVGIVVQPQSGSPPDVYIPLARAQALATAGPSSKSLRNEVNTIYVAATSAADVAAVQAEIKHLLPGDTVTTAASLASQVTGSVSSTAKLANELGRWLSILVLIAAFAVASLLTMAAVARRVRGVGTLKALGGRSRRLTAPVLGESGGGGHRHRRWCRRGGPRLRGRGDHHLGRAEADRDDREFDRPARRAGRWRRRPAELLADRDPHGGRADVRVGHRGRDRRRGPARA